MASPNVAVSPTLMVKHGYNSHRITLREFAEIEGYESIFEMLEELASDSVVPALCDEGCEVEPDGRCEHDCPSILLAAGMI